MKTFVALLIYCLVFSFVFVTLYPLYFEEKVPREIEPSAFGGRLNKAAHVANAVDQRQVLSLYEDSESPSDKYSPEKPK